MTRKLGFLAVFLLLLGAYTPVFGMLYRPTIDPLPFPHIGVLREKSAYLTKNPEARVPVRWITTRITSPAATPSKRSPAVSPRRSPAAASPRHSPVMSEEARVQASKDYAIWAREAFEYTYWTFKTWYERTVTKTTAQNYFDINHDVGLLDGCRDVALGKRAGTEEPLPLLTKEVCDKLCEPHFAIRDIEYRKYQTSCETGKPENSTCDRLLNAFYWLGYWRGVQWMQEKLRLIPPQPHEPELAAAGAESKTS